MDRLALARRVVQRCYLHLFSAGPLGRQFKALISFAALHTTLREGSFVSIRVRNARSLHRDRNQELERTESRLIVTFHKWQSYASPPLELLQPGRTALLPLQHRVTSRTLGAATAIVSTHRPTLCQFQISTSNSFTDSSICLSVWGGVRESSTMSSQFLNPDILSKSFEDDAQIRPPQG